MDWSNISHIITQQELKEAAELACDNLLDSVEYMSLMSIGSHIDIRLSNLDLWISDLSRKVESYNFVAANNRYQFVELKLKVRVYFLTPHGSAPHRARLLLDQAPLYRQ